MNVETAKQLLKKALAIGDAELIELANKALESTEIVDNKTVICKKCNSYVEEGRKSCPKCKGRKFVSRLTSNKKKASVVNIDLEYSQKILKSLHKEDTEDFDKKVKFSVSERRDIVPEQEVKCDRCNKIYKVSGNLFFGGGEVNHKYICGKCT